ncbi:MAG: hypothetical protein ACXWLM_05450, partial [Myxococcales bacterium]
MKLRAVLLALLLGCGHKGGGVQNTPPRPHVSAPADGAEVRAGTPVVFEGAAVDDQDGALHGASLRWKSSLQGELGAGGKVTVALQAGTHAISLTATDSDGL